MTITVAIVEEWVVTQVIDIDDSQYQQYSMGVQAVIDVTNIFPQPQVGWGWTGNQFISNGAVASWKITKLAFNERFQPSELVGIIEAAAQQNTAGYTLTMMLQRQALATYIDLSRSDTIAGVEALVTFGLLSAERANQILTTPPSAIEIYQG